jgi:hypothetical protein
VHLTGKEYQMLELLSLRKGTTLTKEMFLNHLYGGMDEPELKIIDVFICKLRKKLSEATGGDNYIETVWGRGYVLRDPEPSRHADPQAAIGLTLRPAGPPRVPILSPEKGGGERGGWRGETRRGSELTEAEARGRACAASPAGSRAANRAYHQDDAPEI